MMIPVTNIAKNESNVFFSFPTCYFQVRYVQSLKEIAIDIPSQQAVTSGLKSKMIRIVPNTQLSDKYIIFSFSISDNYNATELI